MISCRGREWVDLSVNVDRTKRLLGAGFTVQEIARFLRLEESTIETFKAAIDEAERIKNEEIEAI